ncbi:MAG: hypothetical protein B7733_01180 [Myxococcales bacterium FL481]|nr:MAG: hypothetical protein B7733_01180 [Myxococcales bacterium FL481]
MSPSFDAFAEQLIDTAGLRALTAPSSYRGALEFIAARLAELPRLESLHIWSDASSATSLAGRAWTDAAMLETLHLTGVQIHGDIAGDYPALRTIEIEDIPCSEVMHNAWVRAAPHARILWRRDELGSAIESADRLVVRPTASCWHWWRSDGRIQAAEGHGSVRSNATMDKACGCGGDEDGSGHRDLVREVPKPHRRSPRVHGRQRRLAASS